MLGGDEWMDIDKGSEYIYDYETEYMIDKNDNTNCKILVHNIRSVDKNLEGLLCNIENMKIGLDIFGCTEAWLEGSKLNYDVKGYKNFIGNCKLNKASGVILYVKNCIKCTVYEPKIFRTEVFDFVCVKCYNFFKRTDCVFGIMYRSPSTDENMFIDYWSKIVNHLYTNNITAIIMGDFNLNMLDTSNGKVIRMIEMSEENNFRQIISKSTRDKGLLDCFWTNIEQVNFSYVIKSGVTDHFPCLMVVENFKVNNVKKEYHVKIDNGRVINDINNMYFGDILTINDVALGVNTLTGRIENCIRKYTVRIFVKNKYTIPFKPWITKGI